MDQEFERAKQLVIQQGKASLAIIRNGLGVSLWSAYKLIDRLEKHGVISGEWDIFRGGYPVLAPYQGAGK